MPIIGLGPHGERASSLVRLELSAEEAETIRAGRFRVAIVLHTTASDWARQQIAGMIRQFEESGTDIVEIVDCRFSTAVQNAALERLAGAGLSGVISLPVGNAAVADAHRAVVRSGASLVLLDNAPAGLAPGLDYVCVVSADNFGLGQIAAELLSPCLPQGSLAGIISYGSDFFATQQREIAFRKWMGQNRPDIGLKAARFTDVNLVAPIVDGLIAGNLGLAGLFAVWDAPAMQAVAALKSRMRSLPITTVDLGNEVAIEMARGGPVKGLGAQQPYDQGMTAATALLQCLAGRPPSCWIALPGLRVTQSTLVDAYQKVWHTKPPHDLMAALGRPS